MKNLPDYTNPKRHSDAGMGLVEIIVALLIFAMLSAAFIPVLIQNIKLSHRNAIIAETSHVVNDMVERHRALASSNDCTGFMSKIEDTEFEVRGAKVEVKIKVTTPKNTLYENGSMINATGGDFFCDNTIVTTKIEAIAEHKFILKNPILTTQSEVFISGQIEPPIPPAGEQP